MHRSSTLLALLSLAVFVAIQFVPVRATSIPPVTGDVPAPPAAKAIERRGLNPNLARVVARDLMRHDALAAHARDELGLSQELTARPLQAALASAATFAVGAGVPVLTMFSRR